MNPADDLQRLEGRLDRLAEMLEWPEDRLYLRVETVSAWSPAQHVDHVLLSLQAFFTRVAQLEAGREKEPAILPSGRPTWVGRIILWTRWIPRGRGEAPQSVLPDPRPVRHRLKVALGRAREKARELRDRAASLGRLQGVLPHPLLGAFDACAWIRFADLHTAHHLALASDVDRHRAIGVPDVAPRGAGEEAEYGVRPEAP